jgi:CRP-like cAMP-binding protein/predicted GNAT family N-acyltransferase
MSANEPSANAAPPKIRIGLAQSEAEREAVYRFRYSVYVDEMGKTGLAYADHAKKRLTDSLDETGKIYVATADGDVVATLRVNHATTTQLPEAMAKAYGLAKFKNFPQSALSFTSRLMVTRNLRGSSALNLLLAKAYADGLEEGTLFDICNCTPALVELYEHLGYRPYTENFTDPEVGYRVPMVLVLRDAKLLEAIRAPFWRKLKDQPSLWESGAEQAQWLNKSFPVSNRTTEWLLDDDSFWRFLTDRLSPGMSRRLSFMDGLSDEERKRILKSGSVLSCKPGDPIIRAGEVGSELYVILSGLAEVRIGKPMRRIALFEPGQVFGEIAFIADIKRSADVIALADSDVLAVSQAYLRKLMKSSPELAAKVLFNLSRILCERLVFSNRDLSGGEAKKG